MRFKNSPITLALISALTAIPTYAEEDKGQSEANDTIDRIQVTGSRIARINTHTPSPVISVDAEAVKASGYLNINELLTELPQFVFGVGTASSNQDGFSNAGLNAANLRNLGTERTLTLINGRRVVQSTYDTGEMVTDTSYIPTELIDRIDILTGGAASTYGADAVAGVVNYVMKKNYEGTKISGQYGGSAVGDGEESTFTITTGHNFDDQRGNVVFSLDYYNQERAKDSNRPGSGTTRWINNPLSTGTGDGHSNKIVGTNLGWPDYNVVGQLMGVWDADNDRTNYYDISGDEALYMYNSNDKVGPFYIQNSDSAQGYELDTFAMTRNPFERHTAYLLFNYELDDNTSLTTDFRYTKVESNLLSSPEFNYGQRFININDFAQSNLVLPSHVQNLLAQDDGYFQTSVGLYELGPRKAAVERDLFAFSATLEGEFENGWVWDAYASSGVTHNDSLFFNRTDKRRLPRNGYQTLSASGEICNGNNCPAFNPLLPMSQEAIDYVRVAPYGSQIKSEQHTFAFTTSGDLLELPYGALAFAAGAEVRRESLELNTDEAWQNSKITGSSRLPWDAGRTIKELYFELEAPVLGDTFLVEELVLSAAGRVSDYTYSGKHNTWKLGATWTIIDGLAMRSTLAHTVRAPQLVEQFRAASLGWRANIEDPCDKLQIANAANSDRAKTISNCKAFGITDPESWDSPTATDGGVNSISGGNIALQPEKADTLTIGVVYTPNFIDNLSLTVDYFDIDLTNAMQSTGIQNSLDKCATADDINSDIYCALVNRNSTGQIDSVLNAVVNQALRGRRAVDFEISYLRNLESYGEIDFSIYVTKLIHSTSRDSIDNDEEEFRGIGTFNSNLRGRLTMTYRYEDISINWITNYAEGVQVDIDGTYDLYEKPFTEDALKHDVRIAYKATDNTNLYFGIRNVFDKTYYDHPTTASGLGQYDSMGRFFYGGISYEF
ncbi:TonB-dependent receptor [Pseudoalteromonas sp. MMG013]|uniref:TonB-dependent receptor domain-containing protein n=1 Tax=Pseudoalteromonas sp. MMG013 TaxID=2822687 RepID=UPI001B396BA4|nr:TonB-dependent receptor [Pseudoalteromonas sp. MMG013]MBQ4860080.1 TonB-dependent receptor [Pseudoalteromonas sp. MMG013]